jgi:hypothetical protein
MSGGMILILEFDDCHGCDENVHMLTQPNPTQPNFIVLKNFHAMPVG